MEIEINHHYQRRRKMMSLNFPLKPFSLTEQTGPIIPSLCDIILDSFGRFSENFAVNHHQTPIPLPPILATKLIHKIANNPNATDQDLNMILYRILSSGSPVTNINLQGSHLITKFTCMNLSQLFQQNRLLTLNLSYASGLLSEHLQLLFTPSFRNLKNLNVEGCVAFDDIVFQSFLQYQPTLEILIVSNCVKITDKSVALLQNIHSLTCFKANNLQLTINGLQALHGLLEFENTGNNNLDDNCLYVLCQRNRDLKRVCFGNARLSDECIARFLQQLNGNLIHLNIANCSRAGSLTLSQLFDSQFALNYLNISNCFGMNGDEIINAMHPIMFSSQFRWVEELVYLNVSGCTQLSENFIKILLSSAPKLSTIVLDDTLVSDSALQEYIQSSITYFQKTRRSLHVPGMKIHPLSISLKRCLRLTDNAYTYLFQTRGSDITSFNISFSPSLTQLSLNTFSCYSSSITSFYSTNNDMITETCWCRFISSSPQLKVLFISNNRNVTNGVINQIRQSCPSISHLDISSCPSLDDTVIPILSQMHSLEYLDISFNTLFTGNGIVCIANSLPRLSTFSMQGIHFTENYLFTSESEWMSSLNLNFVPNSVFFAF